MDAQSNLTLLCGIEEPKTSLADVFLNNKRIPVYSYLDKLEISPAEFEGLSMVESVLFGDMPKVTRLKNALRKLDYDFVLIDCPPSCVCPVSTSRYG